MPSKLARASFWAVAGQGLQYAVTFLLLIYLAHVLKPRDFGLMATVSIGLELGMQVARWGQVELLQQPRNRNDETRNQSLRLSLAIACVFAAAFVGSAYWVGKAYKSHELTLMMYLCAPVFLFSAAGTTPEAILRSEFRFRLLAFRNNVTTLISAVVVIVMAARGYGALALAAQRLVQAMAVSLWVWTAVDWRPRLKGPVGWSRALVRDGANIMVGTVLPLLAPRSVDLFVSFMLGPVQLGLMRVAYRINDFVGQMVVVPLVGVANAQLANHGGDLEAMRRSYLRLTQASVALMCPALIGLALVAPEAIPLLFGHQWQATIPLVQIISLLAVVAPMNYYFSAAMVALGHSRLVLRQGLFQVVLALAISAAAAQVSLTAVVIANVIRGTVVGLYNIFDLRRRMGLRFIDLWHYLAAPYIATLAMSLAVILARYLLGGALKPLPTLLVLGSTGAAAYVATLWLGGRVGLWPAHASIINKVLPARWRERAAVSG